MMDLKWYLESPSIAEGLFYWSIRKYEWYKMSKLVSECLRGTLKNSNLIQIEKIQDGDDTVVYETFPLAEIKADEYNYYITFHMLNGQTVQQWENKASAFSSALRGDLVKYEISRGRVQIVVQHKQMKVNEVTYKNDRAHYLNIGYKPGEILKWNFDVNPHMLVIGVTGSGKSTFLRNLLVQIPREWIRIVDGKTVEFTFLHDLGYEVVTSASEMMEYLDEAENEMERRYQLMTKENVDAYGDCGLEPYFLLIDEYISLAESLPQGKGKAGQKSERDVMYEKLFKLSMKGRQAGVYLILVLQRPDAAFLPSAVRDNLTTKVVLKGSDVAFKMAFDDSGKQLEPLPPGQGYCGIDGEITSFSFPDYKRKKLMEDLQGFYSERSQTTGNVVVNVGVRS